MAWRRHFLLGGGGGCGSQFADCGKHLFVGKFTDTTLIWQDKCTLFSPQNWTISTVAQLITNNSANLHCFRNTIHLAVGKPIALGLQTANPFWTNPCSLFANWGSTCRLRRIIGGCHPLLPPLATALPPGPRFIELLSRRNCLPERTCRADFCWLPAEYSYRLCVLWLVCFMILSTNLLLSKIFCESAFQLLHDASYIDASCIDAPLHDAPWNVPINLKCSHKHFSLLMVVSVTKGILPCSDKNKIQGLKVTKLILQKTIGGYWSKRWVVLTN